MNSKPITEMAADLCYAIERLPASEQQTGISIMASNLSQSIRNVLESFVSKMDYKLALSVATETLSKESMGWKARSEKAEAACAHLRAVLERLKKELRLVSADRQMVNDALKHDAGQGWHSPEEWAALTAERKAINEALIKERDEAMSKADRLARELVCHRLEAGRLLAQRNRPEDAAGWPG